MVQVCRVCGIRAGGLVRNHYEPQESNWPESDLCPNCIGKPTPPDEDLESIIKAAIKSKEKTMTVRCKFVCNYKDEKTGQVTFSPVYSGSEENKVFFQATPGGQIQFYTVNPSAFNALEMGKEYYIDISPAN